MTSWHSYPKIWALGHSAITELLWDEVTVEEKVDGSQFSFGVFNGELKVRSKGKEIYLDAPEKMFNNAITTVLELKDKLTEGYTYRAEYLQKPKHNVLAYDRIPNKHLIIFDISPAQETYLSYEEKKAEADRLGLEVVPLLFKGKIDIPEHLVELLETKSILGGQKIEGFVIKNYKRFGVDKKVLLGKYVSEAFKEVHAGEWKEANPGQNDIIQKLVLTYKTPARWDKCIQHLKERGELENSPRDIGKLLKEAHVDTKTECEQEIKEVLFAWAWPKIARSMGHGFPEYYKKKLLQDQFNNSE